jgi:uncharacterized protein
MVPGITVTGRLVRILSAAAICAGLAACGSTATASHAGAAAPTRAASSTQDAASSVTVDTSVSFVVNDTTTYGTLEIPAHRAGQRLAAALLLAGSGPTDRNGDDAAAGLEPHTLQLIAGLLGRMGIITLRFDKYFAGQTGGGAYASDPDSINLGAFIRQADAAYDFLRGRPAVNPRRMLIAGHSEGGMYALLVAESVSPRPAGLALIEPQDERLLSLVQLQTDEQLNADVAQGILTTAAAQRSEQAVQRAIAEFRAGQLVSASGMTPLVVDLIQSILLSPANAAYVRSDDAVYPPALAAKLPSGTRVLVTDGTDDLNVPPATITPLVTALTEAGAIGPGLRLLSGVNHLLHLSTTAENASVLAPSAVTALQAWAQPYANP